MRRFARAFVVAGAGAGALPLLSCDAIQDRFRECRQVTVELRTDRQTLIGANLIAENEAVTAATFVAPGASRQVELCVERGDRKRFIAIRDSRPVAQATCTVTFSKTGAETARPQVVLQPAGLACIDW